LIRPSRVTVHPARGGFFCTKGNVTMTATTKIELHDIGPPRRQLHELAIENDCYILTAQVDEGPLRAGVWNA
jgi:hypothetical protein